MSAAPVAAGSRSILDAATALFADEGYDSVSVALIAEKAGVCKANVFHHFPSKEDLYLAVIKEASAVHADYAEQLYRTPGSSADKVRKLIEFEIRNMVDHRQRTRLIMREVSNGGHARARKLVCNVFQRNFSAVVSIFEQGRVNGEFHASVDPAAAAMLLGGAAQFFFSCRETLHELCKTNSPDTPETYARRVATLILSGVLRTPAVAESAVRRGHARRRAAK